jgi:hypothetical protein
MLLLSVPVVFLLHAAVRSSLTVDSCESQVLDVSFNADNCFKQTKIMTYDVYERTCTWLLLLKREKAFILLRVNSVMLPNET